MKILICHPSNLTPGSPSCLVRGFGTSDAIEDGWMIHAILEAELPDRFAADLVDVIRQYGINYADATFQAPIEDSAYAVEGYAEWLMKTDAYWNVRYKLAVRRPGADCWVETCRRTVHDITTP